METLRSRGLVTGESVEGVGLEPRPLVQLQSLLPPSGYNSKWGRDPENPVPAISACPLPGSHIVSIGSGISCWPTGQPGSLGHVGPLFSWLWRPRMQTDVLSLPSPAMRHSVPWDVPCGLTWAVSIDTGAHTYAPGYTREV